MLAGNDVSQVLFSIIVAYYGNYGNRPHWMGIGVISASIACFIAASPHLMYGAGLDADHTALTNSLVTPWNNASSNGKRTLREMIKGIVCFRFLWSNILSQTMTNIFFNIKTFSKILAAELMFAYGIIFSII